MGKKLQKSDQRVNTSSPSAERTYQYFTKPNLDKPNALKSSLCGPWPFTRHTEPIISIFCESLEYILSKNGINKINKNKVPLSVLSLTLRNQIFQPLTINKNLSWNISWNEIQPWRCHSSKGNFKHSPNLNLPIKAFLQNPKQTQVLLFPLT